MATSKVWALSIGVLFFLGCNSITVSHDAAVADDATTLDAGGVVVDAGNIVIDAAPKACTSSSECDDSNSCTDDVCSAEGVCSYSTNILNTCDDQDACTSTDLCLADGTCAGTALDCDDDNQCTNDLCESGVCEHEDLSDTSCGSDATSECDNADVCISGTCSNNPAEQGATCGTQDQECLANDSCDGAGSCVDNGNADNGMGCGSSANSACDNPDSCQNGICAANPASAGMECGPLNIECRINDTCDGAGSCVDNGDAANGISCGNSSSAACDSPDTCQGGSCASNFALANAPCGDQGVTCLVDDTCNGTGSCTDNGNADDGTNCGDGSSSACDERDSCSGGACAANPMAQGVACGDQGVACLVDDTCNGTGSCTDNGNAADGSSCDDGDAQTVDECSVGMCLGRIPGCVDGDPDDIFGTSMVGCGGTVTFDQRATLCEAGFTTCSARDWVGGRDASAPSLNYWTNDNLRYEGNSGNCSVSDIPGFGLACADNRPMRVCSASNDFLGNTCTYVNCGYETVSPNEYFGGCDANPTAGTLCCAVPAPLVYLPFDDGDLVNRGTGGPAYNAVGEGFSFAAGARGQGIQFQGPGVTTSLTIPSTLDIGRETPFTISFWFREDEVQLGSYLVDLRRPGAPNWGFHTYHGASSANFTTCFTDDSASSGCNSSYIPPDAGGPWRHLLYRSGGPGRQVEAFLDGVRVYGFPNEGTLFFGRDALFGRNNARYWIDEIKIYEHALRDDTQCVEIMGGRWTGQACQMGAL